MRRYVDLIRADLSKLHRTLWVRRPQNGQEAALMRDQCHLLFLLCMLFSAAGMPNVALSSLAFGVTESPLMLGVVCVVLLLYAGIVVAAMRWKKTGNDYEFLRHSHLLYTLLGFAWGVTIILFSMNGRSDQAVLLLGLAAGVVSTPIISVPMAIAFGFFIPDAILSIYAIAFLMPNASFFSASAFISFTLYVAIGTIFTNLTFNGRSEARTALQREIQTVNVFLREYEEGSPDWLWQTDADGRIELAVPRMAEATGLEPGELNGRAMAELLTSIGEGTRAEERVHQDLALYFQKRQAFRDLLVRYEGPRGVRQFRLTGHPIFNDTGRITGFRGIGRDVTRDQEASEKVSFLAEHDGLTGLLNRRAFLKAVGALCRDKRSFALLLIDLDNFKGINDFYGHYVGDRLLQEVAGRLRQSIRPQDLGARLGGDEFAALIVGADGDEGLAVAQRLALHLGDSFEIDNITILSGASVGVSAFPKDAQDPERLLMMADLTLYKAKNLGKGKALLFAAWIEEEHRQLINREIELREAMGRGEIGVLYQPIVDLKSRRTIAVEALVRWNHPTRGVILPGKFIGVAERTELMETLGELVLRIACRDAASWPDPIQVNVNLSPRQLHSGRFTQILSETLEESGLPPERLAIEITESVLLEQDENTMAQLETIRRMGVKLILDDFGTGYSSLTYLHQVEVSGIKIDAAFTQKLPDPKVAVIYRTIIRLAMDLNIYVVAEGVEEASQLEWLDRNGIRFAQGYLLGYPTPSPPANRVEYLA